VLGGLRSGDGAERGNGDAGVVAVAVSDARGNWVGRGDGVQFRDGEGVVSDAAGGGGVEAMRGGDASGAAERGAAAG
jgi:hypothetical protein